jgi:hypothetical protein
VVERIGIRWPNGPDVSGFMPDYADVVRHRQLPFDMEDPLIFHVLTTLSSGDELLQVMRDGGSLMPASWAEERWGDQVGMIFARDRIAGDDEYLFTTPCNVFAEHHEKAKNNPAVAFRLSYVAAAAKKVAFRVHDLEPPYREAELLVGADSIGLDEDEYDEMSPDELQAEHEEDIAMAVEEQLRAIAECGTQYDAEDALKLTHLYARVVGSFRQESMWVAADDPERVRIFRAAQGLFPECIREAEDDLEWAQDLFIERQVDSLVGSWEDLFGNPAKPLPNFPTRLLTAPSFERPELMVQGSLSLCEAAFYRDEADAWRPVPEEVCLSGRSPGIE